MPRKIIIIRHAETDYNRNKRWQGWTDVSLNKHGRNQAEKLAGRMKGEVVDALYSSDLKRSAQTAEIMARELDIIPVFSEKLRERHMGIFEGMKVEESVNNYKLLLEKYMDPEQDEFKGHEGESYKDLKHRVKSFTTFLKNFHRDQSVVIVTHGVTKYFLLLFLLNESQQEARYQNTSVTILKKDLHQSYRITTFADISHLED